MPEGEDSPPAEQAPLPESPELVRQDLELPDGRYLIAYRHA